MPDKINMRDEEKQVIQMKEIQIIDAISEPMEIADRLFQQGCLTASQIEEIFELKLSQRGKCRRLLDTIMNSDTCKCSLYDFVEVLRLLDEPLVDLADAIEHTADSRGVPKTRSRHEPIVYEKVRKVNVYTTSHRRVEALGHTLKRLSHEGDVQAFNCYVNRIDRIFKRHQTSQKVDILKRMELADLRFTCLEAEIVMRRVYYDESLYEHPVFRELQKVIPYTSNPTVTSMTYLARYGSALSMSDGIEAGLTILQYSKHHAEHIVPCRGTGMVYYIEINLLLQLYGIDPTEAMKKRILKTAELAISQFADEMESVRNDYKRMLLLKMVFCRLGMGLFGDRIEGVVVSEEDLTSAKNYFDFIELPEIWDGMEARRQMLFHLAKTEYFRCQKQNDIALIHAREAHKLGTEKQWKAELPSINVLLRELEAALEIEESQDNRTPDERYPPSVDPVELNLQRLESC